MPERERLTHLQIAALLSLNERGAAMRPISLRPRLRQAVLPLWRRDIIEVWYRCAPSQGSQGPYFGLTISGAQLAQTISDRRRQLGASRASGAGEET